MKKYKWWLTLILVGCGRAPEVVLPEAPMTRVVGQGCVAEACTIWMTGDLHRSDASIRMDILDVLARYPQAMVQLAMTENPETWAGMFGPLLSGLPQGTGSPRRAAAMRSPAVLAYSRNGVAEIWLWDPVQQRRRRILPVEGDPPAPRFDVRWMEARNGYGWVRLYLMPPAPADREKTIAEIRRWLKVGDHISLEVTFGAPVAEIDLVI